MPQILHEVQAGYPGLVIHQVEASVPEQYRQLADGRLDVGIGRAAQAPPQVASHLFRHDPLGVLVPPGHRLAALDAIPVAVLAEEHCCSPKKPGPLRTDQGRRLGWLVTPSQTAR